MFKLKKYEDMMLESILIASDDLKFIINSMSIEDEIAKQFNELINKDILTNYNALNLTDKNTRISFISDKQFQSKMMNSDINIQNLLNGPNNHTTVGRVVSSILKDNGIHFSEKNIDRFVTKFKSEYERFINNKKSINPMSIVSGDDIKYWYYYLNYTQHRSGILHSSCMCGENAQRFLDIYTKNPNECNMIIKLDESNRLVARALIWNVFIDNKPIKYIDRVYYSDFSDIDVIFKWVDDKFGKENLIKFDDIRYNGARSPRMKLKLTGHSGGYKKYPYMDTFNFYYLPKSTLYNYRPPIGPMNIRSIPRYFIFKPSLIDLTAIDGTYHNSTFA